MQSVCRLHMPMSFLFSTFNTIDLSQHAIALLAVMLALLALRRWPLLFALSIWPGTIAHELLHFVAGWLFGAKPVSLSVIPRRKPEGGWVLGSVAFNNLRWWNSAPVGLAPLALIPGSVYLFIASMTPPLISLPSAGIKLVAAQCLIAGWPSPRDWSHAILGLLFIGILALMAYVLAMKTLAL
jgi:hypothetical protein